MKQAAANGEKAKGHWRVLLGASLFCVVLGAVIGPQTTPGLFILWTGPVRSAADEQLALLMIALAAIAASPIARLSIKLGATSFPWALIAGIIIGAPGVFVFGAPVCGLLSSYFAESIHISDGEPLRITPRICRYKWFLPSSLSGASYGVVCSTFFWLFIRQVRPSILNYEKRLSWFRAAGVVVVGLAAAFSIHVLVWQLFSTSRIRSDSLLTIWEIATAIALNRP